MKESSFSEYAFPDNFFQTLKVRHQIRKKIRNFFDQRGYIEVETPIRVRCPGFDPYVDAIPSGTEFFLATSPEFHMKRLLSPEIDRIYQITHAFRAEEEGHRHNSEFSILEWYRTGTDYLGIMKETEDFIRSIGEGIDCSSSIHRFPIERIAVDELYSENAGWRPSLDWDEERYFSDWVEKIEPFLFTLNNVFVFDFPAPLASLSKIKGDNPLVCERFELFVDGIEIANAFTELTDYDEHLIRFKKVREKRNRMGKDQYPMDRGFLNSLKSGIPECGGIAVGFDRLIMAILDLDHIDFVQSFPLSRL